MATMRDDDLERATAQAMEDEERDTATEQAMDDESLASATGRAMDDEEQPLPSEIWARNAQNRIFAANDAPLPGDAGGLGVVFGASGRTRPAPRTSMPLGGMSGPESEDRARVMREALEAIRSTRTVASVTPDASSVTAGSDGDGGLSRRSMAYDGAQTMRPTYRLPGAEAAHDAELRAGDHGLKRNPGLFDMGFKMGKGGISEGASGHTPLGGLSPEPDGKDYNAITPDDPELADPFAQKTTGAGSVTAAAKPAAAPAKPSTLQSFFGDKEDNNPSWIARRGAEWNTIGSDRKPDYGVADEMDARRAKIAADRKAAMAAERQRGLDASLMRLRELQGKAAEATARAAGQPKPAAVDPFAADKGRKYKAEADYWERKAEAPIGASSHSAGTTGGRGATGGGGGGKFTQNDADIAAKLYMSGNKFPLGRDPTGEKAAMVLRSIERIAKENGIDPANVIAKAKADMGALNNITKQNAQLEGQEGSIDSHFDILLNASDDVLRTNSPLVNKALNWGMSEVVGDANTSMLINAIETSASEYAKYMATGGQTTDMVRAKAERMLGDAMSEGTLKKVVAQMRQEIAAKKKAMAAAREGTAGRIRTVGSQEPSAPPPDVPSLQSVIEKNGPAPEGTVYVFRNGQVGTVPKPKPTDVVLR